MPKTQAILSEVGEERARQDAEWGRDHDDGHTQSDWVALLTRHAGLAVNDGVTTEDADRYRRQLVRVAALAVAAVESLDRKRRAGVPCSGRGKGY